MEYLDTHKILKRFIEKNDIHVVDDLMEVPQDIPESFVVHVLENHIGYFYTKEDALLRDSSKYQRLY